MTLVLWGHYYLAPWIIIKGIIGATHTLDNCTGLSYHRVLPWKFKSFSNYHKNNHVTIVFVYKTVALKGYLEARGVNNCCEYQGVLPTSSFQRSKLLSIRWFLKHESKGEIKESYDCLPVTKHFFSYMIFNTVLSCLDTGTLVCLACQITVIIEAELYKVKT